jgi:membrane glycosyltransferase
MPLSEACEVHNSKSAMGKLHIVREFWHFLKIRKKFWLAPIVVVLVLLSVIIVAAQGSALAPFIYALF